MEKWSNSDKGLIKIISRSYYSIVVNQNLEMNSIKNPRKLITGLRLSLHPEEHSCVFVCELCSNLHLVPTFPRL